MSKTDMDISFCKPLSVKGFVGKYHFLRKYTSWLFSTETCSQMVVSTHRRKLTDVFMKDIYTSVIVNFDHVFCMALESIHHFQMNKMLFLQSLYVAVQKMKDIPTYSFHETLHEEIIDMFYEDSWTPLQSIVDLAKENGILEEKESHYKIHKIQIALRYILHDARLKNTIQVITNELRPLKPLVKVIKDQVNAKPRHLKKALIKEMIKEDEQIFRKDHQESFSLDLSQDKVLGKPFMLKHNNNAMGVVLCHGYLSLPAQMNNLAVHLHKLGMNVYVVRLKGHGTVPSDISKVTMEDWRRSFDRAYAVMSAYCRKVVVGGFSLGGIMALWRAAQYKSGIQGVFSINAPIKLCDMKAHFVKSIGIYNSLLDSLNLDGVTLESIDNHSECADLNYNKNYLKGIVQLNRSVSICWNNLAKVKVPTLLIQAANDPVVKSQSAQMIYDRLGSTQKELVMLPLDHHNILYFDGAASVHQRVEEFLQELI
jgi:esterase/lipase